MKIVTTLNIVEYALARHGVTELAPEEYPEIVCAECGEPVDCCYCWCYFHADEVDTAAVPCAKCYCDNCGKPKLFYVAQGGEMCGCNSDFRRSPSVELKEARSLWAHPECS